MKIIEALKKIKDLSRKIDEITPKIRDYCADYDIETPTYPDQRTKIQEWLQSCHDMNKEILRLRIAIQKTNLDTMVTIELDGKQVTKSIAEWIHRRKDLAKREESFWRLLTDRGLRENQFLKPTPNTPEMPVKRRLYFDASMRDQKIELYRSEPSKIDATLEVINAVTDLKEQF